MTKISSVLAVLLASLILSLPAFAGRPCLPLVKVCQSMGYSLDNKRDLAIDCLLPIIRHEITPPKSFSQETLDGCKAMIDRLKKEQ